MPLMSHGFALPLASPRLWWFRTQPSHPVEIVGNHGRRRMRAQNFLEGEHMARNVALITGITGQDGAYLAEFLLDRGYVVHGE